MVEIYRNRDSVVIGHLQSLLESAGIRTYLKNEHVASTTIPFPEVTPAICILEDSDVERAIVLVKEHIAKTESICSEEQVCPSCGDVSPGTFSVCWKCEAPLV